MKNIPLYVYTTFSLSIHPSMDISFVSTSWLLWLVLWWTWECYYLFKILLSILSDKYPEAGSLNHMVVLFLIFWGYSMLFSIAVYHSAFPPTMYKGSNFSTFLLTLVFSCFFDSSHPDRYKVTSHCGFDLHSPGDYNTDHLFIYILAICRSSWEKCLFQSLTHFLIGLLDLFAIEL